MRQRNQEPLARSVGGPYTNVVGFNLSKMRRNITLALYIKAIKESDHIYFYRWGDLPLWGEALSNFFTKDSIVQSSEIQYYHGSHNCLVNDASKRALATLKKLAILAVPVILVILAVLYYY